MTILDWLHMPEKSWASFRQLLRTLHCKASRQHEEHLTYTKGKGRHVRCQACGFESEGDMYCTLVKGASPHGR